MKNIFKYSIIVLLLLLSSFASIDDVVNAIKNGSASRLSKYFDNTIEITITDKSNTYSKSQAELVLKDFFENNVVKDFEVLYKGDNTTAGFIVGTLQTRNGVYKTTIYLKQKGTKQLLQELKFEK